MPLGVLRPLREMFKRPDVLCSRPTSSARQKSRPGSGRGITPVNQFANISSFAEQMLVHEHAAVKVRDGRAMEQLALIGCGVTTGLGAALNTARVEPGSTVAVIGCGGVGLNCIQGAALAGALRIIAIDAVETKLSMALEFGATDVVDASGGGVVEKYET